MKHNILLLVGAIAVFTIGVSSAFLTVIETQGHGVCAMMSCDAMKSCYPLTIIQECGQPTITPERLILVTAMFGAVTFGFVVLLKNKARNLVAI